MFDASANIAIIEKTLKEKHPEILSIKYEAIGCDDCFTAIIPDSVDDAFVDKLIADLYDDLYSFYDPQGINAEAYYLVFAQREGDDHAIPIDIHRR